MNRIPTNINGTENVELSANAISFKGVHIQFTKCVGISFGPGFSSQPFLYQASAVIRVRSESQSVKIPFLKQGFKSPMRRWPTFEELRALDTHTNYRRISWDLLRMVAPHIVNRLVSRILSGQTVTIGKLAFDLNGITSASFFGARKRAAWSDNPEVRSISKTLWYTVGTTSSGIIEVAYHYPPTGAIITIGSVTSMDENGCFVPGIIDLMKTQLNSTGK